MEVRELEPTAVWNCFADLNAVPRPSNKEEGVIRFMLDFGQSLELETFSDAVGNVIIRKPASDGLENRKTVTLQSHLDMVHQKNADTVFDFDTQGIVMVTEGDWVKAEGTTLGADNGIGVAAIMALLQSTAIPHPPLEALFTIDEETGMTGAMGLEAGVLQGEILLNLDTEEDDEIDIGCAGGIDVSAVGKYRLQDLSSDYRGYEIRIKGLQGGHSGMDIHKGLGNANRLMNRLLYPCVFEFDAEIAEIDGGGLRNAIPRESVATVAVPKAKRGFEEAFRFWSAAIKDELVEKEPGLEISIRTVEPFDQVMERRAARDLIRSVYAAYNGVYAMSTTIPDLVETSNNLARVAVSGGRIQINCLTRSSRESGKMDLAKALRSAFELAGYEVTFSGSYPGWNPNPNSEILGLLTTTYKQLFTDEPRVVACHAGLECGILGQNYPNIDMISFGPTIRGAHSPDERVSIRSVQKFWTFLKAILADSPKK